MKTRLTTLAVLGCAISLSATVHAECQMSPATNAISVQDDSGQGNYDCTVLKSPDENDLEPLIEGIDYTLSPNLGTIGAGESVEWKLIIDPESEVRRRVYFVSTNNSGQGKRCNYLYDGTKDEGAGLGAIAGTVNNVTICADPVLADVEAEPTTNIIDTVTDQCLTTVNFADGGTPENPNVTVGFSTGVDGQTITICGNTDTSELSSLLPTDRQLGCTPPPYVQQIPTPPDGQTCDPDPNDGSIPLSCAPVDITKAPGDLEYCWYYENRVCEGALASQLGYCSDLDVTSEDYRNPNNFPSYVPRTKIDSFPVQIDVFKGSPFCYTTYFYGVAYVTCYP